MCYGCEPRSEKHHSQVKLLLIKCHKRSERGNTAARLPTGRAHTHAHPHTHTLLQACLPGSLPAKPAESALTFWLWRSSEQRVRESQGQCRAATRSLLPSSTDFYSKRVLYIYSIHMVRGGASRSPYEAQGVSRMALYNASRNDII